MNPTATTKCLIPTMGVLQRTTQKTILTPPFFGAFLSLLLLCSCATENSIPSRLPADVPINRDAGCGNLLQVTLRLESGEELQFVVDTGTGVTCFDTSMESKLGKPLGAVRFQQWGKFERKKVYATPKLYLGGAPLMTGNRILTMDLKHMPSFSDRPVMGILGMDVLGHYCIQLDFAAGKMRFLNDEKADKQTWGRAFPIVGLNAKDARPAVAGNLFGAQGPHSLIDSGYITAGWLMPQYYRQWTNQAVPPEPGEARSPDGRFGGEIYPQVSLREEDVESDGLGLAFLARHLVTLDFPRQTLYLKRTSIGPLADAGVGAAMNFLKDLKEKGRLPGWSKDENGKTIGGKMDFAFTTATVDVLKNDDSSIYHYKVTRASEEGPWKLQKAWRTDQTGRTLEEYPVP